MTQTAVEHLTNELTRLINRFRSEYEMNYAELVGAIELVKADIIDESLADDDVSDDEDGEEWKDGQN